MWNNKQIKTDKMKKTYSYRIIGTSIMSDTEFTTLRELKNHILGFFGECKIEYWGKKNGTKTIKNL